MDCQHPNLKIKEQHIIIKDTIHCENVQTSLPLKDHSIAAHVDDSASTCSSIFRVEADITKDLLKTFNKNKISIRLWNDELGSVYKQIDPFPKPKYQGTKPSVILREGAENIDLHDVVLLITDGAIPKHEVKKCSNLAPTTLNTKIVICVIVLPVSPNTPRELDISVVMPWLNTSEHSLLLFTSAQNYRKNNIVKVMHSTGGFNDIFKVPSFDREIDLNWEHFPTTTMLHVSKCRVQSVKTVTCPTGYTRLYGNHFIFKAFLDQKFDVSKMESILPYKSVLSQSYFMQGEIEKLRRFLNAFLSTHKQDIQDDVARKSNVSYEMGKMHEIESNLANNKELTNSQRLILGNELKCHHEKYIEELITNTRSTKKVLKDENLSKKINDWLHDLNEIQKIGTSLYSLQTGQSNRARRAGNIDNAHLFDEMWEYMEDDTKLSSIHDSRKFILDECPIYASEKCVGALLLTEFPDESLTSDFVITAPLNAAEEHNIICPGILSFQAAMNIYRMSGVCPWTRKKIKGVFPLFLNDKRFWYRNLCCSLVQGKDMHHVPLIFYGMIIQHLQRTEWIQSDPQFARGLKWLAESMGNVTIQTYPGLKLERVDVQRVSLFECFKNMSFDDYEHQTLSVTMLIVDSLNLFHIMPKNTTVLQIVKHRSYLFLAEQINKQLHPKYIKHNKFSHACKLLQMDIFENEGGISIVTKPKLITLLNESFTLDQFIATKTLEKILHNYLNLTKKKIEEILNPRNVMLLFLLMLPRINDITSEEGEVIHSKKPIHKKTSDMFMDIKKNRVVYNFIMNNTDDDVTIDTAFWKKVSTVLPMRNSNRELIRRNEITCVPFETIYGPSVIFDKKRDVCFYPSYKSVTSLSDIGVIVLNDNRLKHFQDIYDIKKGMYPTSTSSVSNMHHAVQIALSEQPFARTCVETSVCVNLKQPSLLASVTRKMVLRCLRQLSWEKGNPCYEGVLRDLIFVIKSFIVVHLLEERTHFIFYTKPSVKQKYNYENYLMENPKYNEKARKELNVKVEIDNNCYHILNDKEIKYVRKVVHSL